jgi:hypothetical protein
MEPGRYYLARFLGFHSGAMQEDAWEVHLPVVCRVQHAAWGREPRLLMVWRVCGLNADGSLDYAGWKQVDLCDVKREITEQEARAMAQCLMDERARRHAAIEAFTKKYDAEHPPLEPTAEPQSLAGAK